MKKLYLILFAVVISLMFVIACSPNTGKNVGDGCGTWSEKQNKNDTIAPNKGI